MNTASQRVRAATTSEPRPVTAEEAEHHNAWMRTLGFDELADLKPGDLAFEFAVRRCRRS
jgi:hypothetical protein